MRPIIIGCARRDTENASGFLDGHANEEAQLDHFSLDLALRRQFVQRIVDGEQLIIVAGEGKLGLIEIDPLLSAAVPHGALSASVINENAAHRLGRGGKEVSAVLEFRIFLADQPHPGLVNQCSGLQRLPSRFVRHSMSSELAQFLVNQREQLVCRLGIALLNGIQDVRDVAHL